MKFRKIQMKNFRQFYGEQTILFSISESKNITLIHAENGAGKTAFLNAILWCLYEMTTSNFKEPKKLLNKVAKSEGVKSYSVSIEFEDDKGRVFEVVRSHDQHGKRFRVFEIVNGSYEPVDKANSFINSVIPKDMAKYFFFQGEGIGKMSGSKGDSVVKTAVREILGFTIAELALVDIKRVKSEYRKLLSGADKSGQISSINNEISKLEGDIERAKYQLEKYSSSILLYNNKLDEINDKLKNSNSSTIKQIHSERQDVEQQIKREKKIINDCQLQKRNLISYYATTVFGFQLSELAMDFIDEEDYKGNIPAPYNEQLVSDILNSCQCICGNEIKPGGDAFERIHGLLKQASDPMLESRIRKARSQLTYIKNDTNRAKNDFIKNMNNLADSENRLSELKAKLSELDINIKGVHSLEDINGLEGERSRIMKNLDSDSRASERMKLNLERDEKNLNLKNSELSRLDTYSTEMNKYKSLVDYSEEVEKVLENTLTESENDVEIRIIEKVNKYLNKFVRHDYKAKLDPNTFDIRLVDRDGHIVPESDGQSLLLSLTFISSLIELSRERKNAKGKILTPGAIAPFVVDAPFGDLDNKYKGHVAKAIPDSVEQVIFLLSSSHWEGNVEENIRDKIGAEYNMVIEDSSEQNEKEIDYIHILENKYETVRYSANVDRTVLEQVG